MGSHPDILISSMPVLLGIQVPQCPYLRTELLPPRGPVIVPPTGSAHTP